MALNYPVAMFNYISGLCRVTEAAASVERQDYILSLEPCGKNSCLGATVRKFCDWVVVVALFSRSNPYFL